MDTQSVLFLIAIFTACIFMWYVAWWVNALEQSVKILSEDTEQVILNLNEFYREFKQSQFDADIFVHSEDVVELQKRDDGKFFIKKNVDFISK